MFLELHRLSDGMEICVAVSAITSIFIDEEDSATVVETVTAGIKVTEGYALVKLKLKCANAEHAETFS